MQTATVKLPEEWIDSLDRIAEEHDTSRAAVLRSAIDDGLRAHKYYPEDFAINPERYEHPDAVELSREGHNRP